MILLFLLLLIAMQDDSVIVVLRDDCDADLVPLHYTLPRLELVALSMAIYQHTVSKDVYLVYNFTTRH